MKTFHKILIYLSIVALIGVSVYFIFFRQRQNFKYASTLMSHIPIESDLGYLNKVSRNTKNNVFLYWVGKEYKLITLLRNLIYLHAHNGTGYNVHLITDKNVNDYIKDIPSFFSDMKPARQADFVRVCVIRERGGMWIDSDTLIIDTLDTLFDVINKQDGFFILENNELLWNGIFGSKPNTPLMNKWYEDMMITLDEKKANFHWTAIGSTILENIKKTYPEYYSNYKIFNGLDNLYPVYYKHSTQRFFDNPYDHYKTIIRDYQPLIALSNRVYKKASQYDTISNMVIPLNYFINKSMINVKYPFNNLIGNVESGWLTTPTEYPIDIAIVGNGPLSPEQKEYISSFPMICVFNRNLHGLPGTHMFVRQRNVDDRGIHGFDTSMEHKQDALIRKYTKELIYFGVHDPISIKLLALKYPTIPVIGCLDKTEHVNVFKMSDNLVANAENMSPSTGILGIRFIFQNYPNATLHIFGMNWKFNSTYHNQEVEKSLINSIPRTKIN